MTKSDLHKEEQEWLRRQSATLPPDIIRNDANFEGTLVKGGRPLRGFQRIGTAIVGFCFLLLPLYMISAFVGDLRDGEPLFRKDDLVLTFGATIVMAFFTWLGVRMLWNAFSAPSATQSRLN